MSSPNEAEWILEHQCKADGIQAVRNYRFHPTRKFEIDCAVLEAKAGIEIEGAIWAAGAHSRPLGILRDMEKQNLLLLSGWRVLRYTPTQVREGEAIEGLKRLLGAK